MLVTLVTAGFNKCHQTGGGILIGWINVGNTGEGFRRSPHKDGAIFLYQTMGSYITLPSNVLIYRQFKVYKNGG